MITPQGIDRYYHADMPLDLKRKSIETIPFKDAVYAMHKANEPAAGIYTGKVICVRYSVETGAIKVDVRHHH